MSYDVYLAAPFFNISEKEFNLRLLTDLELSGLRVFSPARDGIVAKNELHNDGDWKNIASRVWSCDTAAIDASKLLLAIIDGRSIDEGVCVEIGFAAAKGKPVIAFNSDDRRQFPWGHNPMIIHPISIFCSNRERIVPEVIRALKSN